MRWIEEARANYGESSLFWQTRVEAQFPTDDTDGIIPKSWLLQARDRYDANPQYWDDLAKALFNCEKSRYSTTFFVNSAFTQPF